MDLLDESGPLEQNCILTLNKKLVPSSENQQDVSWKVMNPE